MAVFCAAEKVFGGERDVGDGAGCRADGEGGLVRVVGHVEGVQEHRLTHPGGRARGGPVVVVAGQQRIEGVEDQRNRSAVDGEYLRTEQLPVAGINLGNEQTLVEEVEPHRQAVAPAGKCLVGVDVGVAVAEPAQQPPHSDHDPHVVQPGDGTVQVVGGGIEVGVHEVWKRYAALDLPAQCPKVGAPPLDPRQPVVARCADQFPEPWIVMQGCQVGVRGSPVEIAKLLARRCRQRGDRLLVVAETRVTAGDPVRDLTGKDRGERHRVGSADRPDSERLRPPVRVQCRGVVAGGEPRPRQPVPVDAVDRVEVDHGLPRARGLLPVLRPRQRFGLRHHGQLVGHPVPPRGKDVLL
ncbi:hypothetical protein AB0J72_33875 [Dactylosporangium sp. NPDC049742]|uniref:hypothetical protein n=1 Tax=Dactylosporangium sp. NPDC049742 TaxID=3154737 RepID=UPI003427A7E3